MNNNVFSLSILACCGSAPSNTQTHTQTNSLSPLFKFRNALNRAARVASSGVSDQIDSINAML